MVLGRDPLDRAVLWRQMYNALRDHGQKGATVEAISAVDIALWDIAGKALGLPVYQLMGGAGRTHVRPYATGFYRTPDTTDANLIDEALLYAEQGFTGMKVKVGFGVEHDARLIRDIRRAVGDRVALMIDANHAYNATDALALALCHARSFTSRLPKNGDVKETI